MSRPNPFTDPTTVPTLYVNGIRLRQRSSALMAAKVSGAGAVSTIVDLASAALTDQSPIVLDVGCGPGQTTGRLAQHLAPRGLIALDRSPTLLQSAQQRTSEARPICADFHHLPLASDAVDLAVAAFCLYHSPEPSTAVVEIARCLKTGGVAILATKSADSYADIDQLIAASGLDSEATQYPSLYSSFHTTNAAGIVAPTLCIEQVVAQRHVFRFADFSHLAAYVATSPKYKLPARLISDPSRLAAELRRRVPDRPLVTTSTVGYIVGTRP